MNSKIFLLCLIDKNVYSNKTPISGLMKGVNVEAVHALDLVPVPGALKVLAIVTGAGLLSDLLLADAVQEELAGQGRSAPDRTPLPPLISQEVLRGDQGGDEAQLGLVLGEQVRGGPVGGGALRQRGQGT